MGDSQSGDDQMLVYQVPAGANLADLEKATTPVVESSIQLLPRDSQRTSRR